MKRLYTILLLALIYLGSSAQSFEGTITQTIKVVKGQEEMAGMEGMADQVLITSVKGPKTRVEQKSVAGTNVIITDESRRQVVMLMDMMGQRIAMVMPLEEGGNPNNHVDIDIQGELTWTDEYKTIAGYKCRKALIQDAGNPQMGPTECWFAVEGDFFGQTEYGMPMEYTVTEGDMVLLYQVSEIKETSLDDALFEIPSGYTVRTEADLEQMLPMIMESED